MTFRWIAGLMLSLACPAWAVCSLERIDAPLYPPLAIQARRSAVISAQVTVDAEGYPHSVLSDPQSLFALAIRAALARTRLSPADCAGAEIPVVFRFTIRGTETHQRDTTTVFHAPGEFEISARPFAVQWSRYAPERLEPAIYPPLAKPARLSGSVFAQINVSAAAELSGAPVYFGQAVRSAIARSRLSPADCADATFLVEYSFTLDESAPAPSESQAFQLRTVAPPAYITCAYRSQIRRHWLRRAVAYFAGVKRVA